MDKKQCPVCKNNLPEELPKFCGKCGWEIDRDITLIPSLELPDSVLEDYRLRVKVAREKWGEKEKLEKRMKELEAKLACKKQKTKPPEAPKIEKKPDKSVYSEKTTMPELQRDPFETDEQFEARINEYPPVPVGDAELIKAEYDYKTKIFPVKIKWDKGVDNVAGLPSSTVTDFSIIADIEKAKAVYGDGSSRVVYACLKASGEKVKVAKAVIHEKDMVFKIEDIKKEITSKPKKITSKPTAGKEWKDPVTGMIFIYVPGGKFEMGDVFGGGDSDEKPVHKVTLSGFYIGKYSVTQAQWEKVMGNNPSKFKKGGGYPVENISWDDTKKFIRKLGELNKEQHLFRLPTEAQWEYAARSCGKKEIYAGSDYIDDVAWYDANSENSTHPVGKLKPNGLGLYDMSGNVWEWCEDWFGGYSKGHVTDPTGPSTGSSRVRRGGSWFNLARYCRSAGRGIGTPGDRPYTLGLRLALSPGQQ